jgi:hypothetical protein
LLVCSKCVGYGNLNKKIVIFYSNSSSSKSEY